MANRLTLLFLLVFLLITLVGCGAGPSHIPRINPNILPPEEYEKVKAVRLVEVENLDKATYKFIKKVSGVSCGITHLDIGFPESKVQVIKEPSRKEAEEQVKIHAVKAGGNAIAHLVCVPDLDFQTGFLEFCERPILCSADAIQLD